MPGPNPFTAPPDDTVLILQNQITALQQQDQVERSERIAADEALQAQIAGTISESDLNVEIANREAGDNTLQAHINTLAASISTLTNNLNTEITNRTNVTNALNGIVLGHTTDIALLRNELDQEISDRTDAITSLTQSHTITATQVDQLASLITTVQSTVSGHTASISSEQSARIAADNSIFLQYAVNLNVDGQVIGYIKLDGTGASSKFSVLANQFEIAAPVGGGLPARVPFSIGPNADNTDSEIIVNAPFRSLGYVPGSAGYFIGTDGIIRAKDLQLFDPVVSYTLGAPTISPAPQNFTTGLTLSISAPPSGVTWRYTLDGSPVTSASPAWPGSGSGTIALTSSVTLRVRGFSATGSSAEFMGSYHLDGTEESIGGGGGGGLPTCASVSIRKVLAGTQFHTDIYVTFSCPTAGRSIYYGIDDPTLASPTLWTSGNVLLPIGSIMYAKATATGYNDSFVTNFSNEDAGGGL